jgi:hypothetical protein
MKTNGIIFFMLTLLLCLVSCDDDEKSYQGEVKVNNILFQDGDNLTIPFNEEFILQCEIDISPKNGITPDLEWTSSNNEIEILDTKGGACKLKGTVEEAVSTIIAKSPDGIVIAECNVTVAKIYIKLKSEEGYMIIKPGETLNMLYNILDNNLTVTSVEWSSTDNNIIAVDAASGLVTAKTVGNAEIILTAQTSMGEMIIKEVITIANEIPLTGVYLQIIPGNNETEYTSDDPDNCTTIDAKLNGNKYIYIEVMYLPANTTYTLPTDGSLNPWSDDGQGKYNTNSASGGTGRSDRKVVRVLPKVVGTSVLTANINGNSASVAITIY